MITLQNPGELDLIAIKTMGINVKENDDAIGYFGTGLKYAVAVFLREGIDFKMFIGDNEFQFIKNPVIFRDKRFELCQLVGPMDTTDLGFTTELGKNWDLWQAYREIHSNCLDENGTISEEKLAPKSGYTTIQVDMDINLDEVFLNKENKTLLFSNDDLEIYEGESDVMFYKGIRAKDLEDSSKYTYNIKRECTLTEDRLLCYDWQTYEVINKAIASMENKDIIKTVVTAKNSFEAKTGFSYNTYQAPSEAMKEVVNGSKEVNSSVRDYMYKHTPKEPEPKTRKAFMILLKNLCDDYDVSIDETYNDCLTLQDGVLDE